MAFTPNYFSQQDPEWKNNKLGFSNRTIGTDGCTLTAISMLLKGFGYDETPASLNTKLKDFGRNNGFIDALVVWGAIPYLFPKIKYKSLVICPDHNAPLPQIDAALENGQPVLVELDRSPASGLQNHWVVLYAKDGDDYLMSDPWPFPPDDKKTHLSTRYAFGRTLAKTITAVVWYEMDGIIPPPPTDGFYLRVANTAISGLRIRSQATTASVTLELAPAGSYLQVIENEAGAKVKIGVVNQWIKVRDANGIQGYVAAWYLEDISGSAPVSEPDTDLEPEVVPEQPPAPIGPDALKCYVNPSVGLSGLRMRSEPSINGQTITTLLAASELSVLEDEDRAKSKIGVSGAWIHVQDEEQKQGYVAAWLVVLSLDDIPAPEPVVETETKPKSMSVTVFPSLGENGLRMRAEPSLGGRLLTILKGSTILKVLEENAREKIGVVNEWLHVLSPNGIEGYVAAWYVEESADDSSTQSPPPTGSLTVYVMPLASYGLRMRKGPSAAYPIIKTLMPNTPLTVLGATDEAIIKIGANGEWLKVRDAAGTEGYVAAWYVIR